jgi:hypothetical protein
MDTSMKNSTLDYIINPFLYICEKYVRFYRTQPLDVKINSIARSLYIGFCYGIGHAIRFSVYFPHVTSLQAGIITGLFHFTLETIVIKNGHLYKKY